MLKHFLMIIVVSQALVACSTPNTSANTAQNFADHDRINRHLRNMKGSIDFIKKHAYSAEERTFYSDIDNYGNITSNKVYLVSLSRTIYALAYSSTYFPENLALAKQAAQFLKQRLIHHAEGETYFITEFDVTNTLATNINNTTQLDIWQQAYGLVGLVELYRHWPNPELLATIEQMHNAFIKRFSDRKHGGFYGNVHLVNGADISSKTLQSTIYPVTAYMNNLWLASPTPNKYESTLAQQAEFAFQYLWNAEKGWVNVKLQANWNTCKNSRGESFSVAPGHNFQLAWLLMNTQNWRFLAPEQREKYTQLGKHIVTTTLAKPIWDGAVNKGFFAAYNPANSERLSDEKTWWQHSEALIALSFYERDGPELRALLDFFENHFIDHVNGGEFFHIDNNNQPITTHAKSSLGKSAYHTVEMYRYLIESLASANLD